MINGFGRSLIALSAAALLSVSTATAQDDARTLFQEGVQLLAQNKDAEALEKFKAAVAQNPSMEEAYKLWQETDNRVWSALMIKSDDFAKVARHMLRLARLERKSHSADAGAIQPLVGAALSDAYEARVNATLKLMSDHGDYAVPYFLDALGNADDDDQQTYAIMALQQIGRAATLPLVAALKSDNALVRRNASAALMYIGDNRALPALKHRAESDDDASVREVAQRAVAKIAGGVVGSASSLYLEHSQDYLTGRRLRDGDILDGVWSYEGSKLVHRKVPPSVFPLELAKDAAYGALAVDPSSQEGLIALTRAYVAEKAVVDAALAANPDDESVAALKGPVQEMAITVLAAGPAVVRQAFQSNVQEGMIPAAVASLQTLAQLEDPRDVSDSPLVASLTHPDKRIRYGAALALTGMDADLSAGQRSQLVSALGQAVLEESVRVAQVIDPDDGNAGVYEATAKATPGLSVPREAKTTRGLAMIARFAPDVLVLNENLNTVLVDSVLNFIADRPHLQSTKVILISKVPGDAQEVYGERIHGYIKAPVTEVALRNRIEEVLKGVPDDPNRSEADRVAASAAEAMAKLDPNAYPVADATAQLVTAAGRKEAVAVASLAALGNAGDADQLGAIVKVMTESTDRAAVAAAAAGALGRIMARAGNADQAAVDALAAIAKNKDLAASIRQAAVAALGRAPILPGQRAKLLRSLRVDPNVEG